MELLLDICHYQMKRPFSGIDYISLSSWPMGQWELQNHWDITMAITCSLKAHGKALILKIASTKLIKHRVECQHSPSYM